ncbi:MAG: glycosyltransferase [Anaerolineaceae bacterium]|nr:glycosyltransferase [Anaerolineaceae bacterium]
MGRMQYLLNKSKNTLREDGIAVFIKKTILYVGKQKYRIAGGGDDPTPGKVFMDVLFINGCYLPHPSRYRVTHQREQLLANGITSNEVFFEDLSLELVKHYRMFIFFRCPYTDVIGQFIRTAKEHHKTVLFDVDDLVIDTKYTDQIKYISEMDPEERRGYDSGVERMQQTLCLCDGAITTTERLAEELHHYVPEVYINRNVASEKMVQLSQEAIYNRDVLPYLPQEQIHGRKEIKKAEKYRAIAAERQESGMTRIGYFSGSITHNSDIEMILPALCAIMKRYDNVQLCFVGEMDIPAELKEYQDKIIAKPFMAWEKLPELIASVDINIAPLEKTVFNEAKSENKWVEAALVKVPTVASRVGAFEKMIQDGVTGLLCNNCSEWEDALCKLIEDSQYRKAIAGNAYRFVTRHACTVNTGLAVSQYLRSKMTENLVMVLPSLQTSGGILVALKHCALLSNAGLDVTILNDGVEERDLVYEGNTFFVLSKKQNLIHAGIDKAVATLWTTLGTILEYPNINRRYYLVQNFEVDFYESGSPFRILANQSYSRQNDIQYLTISKWCAEWLKNDYGKSARYARNGINLSRFPRRHRTLSGKTRILVEGNCDDYYKNVDESFRIVNLLDKDCFEIWFMSYQGKPKSWYRVDQFFHRIPNEQVGEIYAQCDILIKSSLLESFSYPPLEMMATGGYCVVAPNEGNIEYLVDGENCLLYKQGDLDSAVQAILRICSDADLRRTLEIGGYKTAESRDWQNLTGEILALYDMTDSEQNSVSGGKNASE